MIGVFRKHQMVRRETGADQHELLSWKPEVVEVASPPVSKELKKRWSYFIRKVYELDPLTCPKCQGEMWFDTLLNHPEGTRRAHYQLH